MTYIIAAVGVLMCVAALVGVAAPAAIAGVASRVALSRPLRSASIASRIVFGAVAILAANDTLYPLILKIIGVVAIMAGTVVAFLDRENLNRRIVKMSDGGAAIRTASVAALALGAFLVHASLQ